MVGIIFSIPSLFSAYMFLSDTQEKIRFTVREQSGIAPINELAELHREIERHRLLTLLYANGAADMIDEMEEQEQVINLRMESISWDKRFAPAFGASDVWKTLSEDWYRTKNNVNRAEYNQVIQFHEQLVKDLGELKRQVAGESELNLDAQEEMKILNSIDSLLFAQLERVSQMSAVAVSIAKQKKLSDANSELLMDVADTSPLIRLKDEMDRLPDGNVKKELAGLHQNVQQSTAALLDAVNYDLLKNKEIAASASDIEAKGNAAVQANNEMYEKVLNLMGSTVRKRLAKERINRDTLLVVVAGAILLNMYLFTALYLSVRRAVKLLSAGSEKMALGDLTVRVPLETNDEIRTICELFNGIANSFSGMVAANLQAAEDISVSSQKLKDSSAETAERSQEISESFSIIAQGANSQFNSAKHSSEQMSDMAEGIGLISNHMVNAAEAAFMASDEASTGETAIHTVIEQMNTISQSVTKLSRMIQVLEEQSGEIGKIVSDIREIAEFTNLLSLNATIEAARAGEHGRGFAVVAAEVRTLSAQSSAAAQRVKDMVKGIQESTGTAASLMHRGLQEVARGIEVVASTGNQFHNVQASVSKVSAMLQDISAVCEQSAAGSELVSEALQEMRDIAEAAASKALSVTDASSLQLSAAEGNLALAEQLLQLSRNLQNSMNKFRLPE